MEITSKQYGELFELRIIDFLVELSNGEISCFRNVIDDNGIDLIIKKKNSFKTLFIQVKGRSKFDSKNQFNQVIYKSTFVVNESFYLLFCLFLSDQEPIFWLIPSNVIPEKLKVHNPKKHREQYNFSATTSQNSKWSEYQLNKKQLIEKLLNLL